MKAKAGEFWVIGRRSQAARAASVPLFEVMKQELALATNMGQALGGLPAFIDTSLLPSAPTKIPLLFQELAQSNVNAIPVTEFTKTPAEQQALLASTNVGATGMMVRLLPQDFAANVPLPALLTSLTNFFGAGPPIVDILIDLKATPGYGLMAPMLQQFLGALPQLGNWRSVTVAAGSFPSTVDPPQGQWQDLDRSDWAGYVSLLAGQLPSAVALGYGDYVCRDSGVPPPFGKASANIRYALTDRWRVRKGALLASGNAGTDMISMCQDLVGQPWYRGSNFSAGDWEYSRIATSQSNAGGGQQWVQWAGSHHVETVAEQLANLP